MTVKKLSQENNVVKQGVLRKSKRVEIKINSNKMKKVNTLFVAVLFVSTILTSCGSESKNVDTCKCLTEPGNSTFMKENEDACRDAISKELGVSNWEKVNMSQNKEVRAKFDALVRRCN
ncbi:hypothetical protein LBMAG25_00220 [Bacteroidota bacterium]|nr:hypothetical protein LBMAG25_00220 [Bacteroidota bacterium]